MSRLRQWRSRRQVAWVGAFAGAGAAGWLLSGQMATDDPFRPLIAGMPTVALALGALSSWLRSSWTQVPQVQTRSNPSQPLRPAAWTAVTAALVLTVLTLRRESLGLTALSAPLAAAWIVLLAHSVFSMLPALRRLLGQRLTVRPHLTFAVLPMLVYGAVALWSSTVRPPDGDEPYYLLLAHSLVFDFDTDLANNYAQQDWQRFLDRAIEPQLGDPRGADGAQYSRHNLLLPLLLAPLYALAGRGGAILVMVCAAGLLAWMTLRLAARVAPDAPQAAFLTWMVMAFSPPLLLYSHQIWVEIPAALALALAVDRWWSIRQHGIRGWPDIVILAAALAVLPLLKLRFLLLATPVLVLVCVALHQRLGAKRATRFLILTAMAAIAVLAGLLMRNQLRFGNPLKMHAWNELAPVDRPVLSFLLGGSGTFFDCAFGLIASAPIWLLLVPAIGRIVLSGTGLSGTGLSGTGLSGTGLSGTGLSGTGRARVPIEGRQLLRDVAFIGLPYFLAIAPRLEWYGGWSPPFRYPFVLLPLLALLLLPLFADRNAGVRLLVGGLGLATFLLAVLWLTVPGWTYNLADGGNHLLDAGSARLGMDLARFFPSMVRPRLATWAWPLLSLLIIPITFLRRPRRDAGVWGAIAMISTVALIIGLARVVPTHTIELEDGQVQTRGGHLSPPTWKIERPRYRAGWTLRRNSEVRGPVIGGGTVRLRMAVRYISNAPERPFFVEVLAGDQSIFRWQAVGHQVWQAIEIGPVVWPANAALVLRGHAEAAPGKPANGVVVDYMDFFWQ